MKALHISITMFFLLLFAGCVIVAVLLAISNTTAIQNTWHVNAENLNMVKQMSKQAKACNLDNILSPIVVASTGICAVGAFFILVKWGEK